MKIKKDNNIYSVFNEGELIAQISDIRKFGLSDINKNHWHVAWKEFGHKTKHRTLKEAKNSIKSQLEYEKKEFPEALCDVYGVLAD